MADARDAFDAALISGMRQQLADGYAHFRAAESDAIAGLAPGSNVDAMPYRLRNCPNCETAAPEETVLSAHGIDLVECPRCKLTYTRQVMEETSDAARYQASMLDDAAMRLRLSGPYLELETARAQYYVDRLNEFAVETGSLLEIGCGTGTFLKVAEAAGWQAIGIEPGQASAAVAADRGCNVVEGYFPQDLPESERAFAAIAILDVLEHFADPVAFLRKIRAHLVPQGRLFVQVPNWDSLLVQLEGARSSVVCPGHWSYFNAESLSAVLRRAGFQCLMTETVLSERDRLTAFSAESLGAVLQRLRPGVEDLPHGADGVPTASSIHAFNLGYKLIGIFAKD